MQALCSANISPSHLTLNDKQEIPKVSRLKINKMQDLLQRYNMLSKQQNKFLLTQTLDNLLGYKESCGRGGLPPLYLF